MFYHCTTTELLFRVSQSITLKSSTIQIQSRFLRAKSCSSTQVSKQFKMITSVSNGSRIWPCENHRQPKGFYAMS